MKRDLVLVQKILEFVEEKGSRLFKGSILIDGYERDAIVHHLYLCADAGFVELGPETLSNRGPLVLTWKGYDYLEERQRVEARIPTHQVNAARAITPATATPSTGLNSATTPRAVSH